MTARGVRLSDKAVNFVPPGRRVRPLRDQIIIKPLAFNLSTAIDAEWAGEVIGGRVVAVGPGCYPNIHARGFKDGKPYHTIRESKHFRPTELKVGDIVHLGGMELGGYLWPKVWFEGDWCVLCREQDVAVLEDE
jgi:hypothetical protein